MPKCPDHLFRESVPADLKILNGTLGLGAPVFIRRDLDLTHAVSFYTIIHNLNPLFNWNNTCQITDHIDQFTINRHNDLCILG